MKVLLETMAWMLCILLVISTTLATPSTAPPIKYTKLSWKPDTNCAEKNNNPKIYSTLIGSLRAKFDSFGKVCKIPVTPKSPERKDEFILVEITFAQDKAITLAFQTSNLYFVGYMDKVIDSGATRANFANNYFDILKGSNLFKDAKIKKQLPYQENYKDLERVAGVGSRQNLPLGIKTFLTTIDAIYGKDYKGKEGNNNQKPTAPEKDIGQNLAQFALMAIQMIAEATRFKYIEGKVKDLGMKSAASFKPDDTFIELEKNWGTFSKLIHKSSPACNPIKSPSTKFPNWPDIKVQVGLLNHQDAKVLGHVHAFMEGIFGHNNAHAHALEFIM